MKKSLSLVFFGSGPVASASLRLIAQTFYIEAIITKPTTKKEMKQACPKAPVYTASNAQELDALLDKQSLKSKVGVLIDFGIIVSEKSIARFEMGIINSHFSMLPELRGADPISFAILEGKNETGVSLMLLVKEMDEGPVIAQKSVSLEGTETTSILTDTLIDVSYSLLNEYLQKYASGEIAPVAQDTSTSASYTRKLVKADGIVDWTKDATEIEREIRAFDAWPKSKTKLGEIEAAITSARVIEKAGPAGKVFLLDNNSLGVYCGKDALKITSLHPAGKKQMDSQAFLAGYKNRIGL